MVAVDPPDNDSFQDNTFIPESNLSLNVTINISEDDLLKKGKSNIIKID